MIVGFVGIGKMGAGMALNLLAAGHDVKFFARSPSSAVNEVVEAGAHQAASLAELAKEANVILLCLTDTQAVREVADGLALHLPAERLVIDLSTNDIDGPNDVSDLLTARGVDYVEAPVTGGVKQARDAALGAIVGANSVEVYGAARPILQAFCKKVVHIGPVGMAARAKLISNFLALGTATLVIEVFKQARALGIDWEPLYELSQLGSGNSSGLQRIVGNAIEGDYKGYLFSVENCLKDLHYLCELGQRTGTASTLAPVLHQIHDDAVRAGHGDRMISELLDPSNDLSGNVDDGTLRR